MESTHDDSLEKENIFCIYRKFIPRIMKIIRIMRKILEVNTGSIQIV